MCGAMISTGTTAPWIPTLSCCAAASVPTASSLSPCAAWDTGSKRHENNGGQKRKKSPGIRRQVVLSFGGFILIILALLWVVQIALLGPFYRLIKINEVKGVAQTLENNLESETLEETASRLVNATNTAIVVSDELGRLYVAKKPPKKYVRLEGLTPYDLRNIFDGVNLQGAQRWKRTVPKWKPGSAVQRRNPVRPHRAYKIGPEPADPAGERAHPGRFHPGNPAGQLSCLTVGHGAAGRRAGLLPVKTHRPAHCRCQ